MCCCGRPTINGEPGAYSWDGKTRGTRPPNPPDLREGDELLYDEPGRCGGIDAHSHHFRLVKGRYGYALLVRHGGGDDSFDLGITAKLCLGSLASLDSNARYWLMHTIYSTWRDATGLAASRSNAEWRIAAAENRIRTRKRRGTNTVNVWIEPPKLAEKCLD